MRWFVPAGLALLSVALLTARAAFFPGQAARDAPTRADNAAGSRQVDPPAQNGMSLEEGQSPGDGGTGAAVVAHPRQNPSRAFEVVLADLARMASESDRSREAYERIERLIDELAAAILSAPETVKHAERSIGDDTLPLLMREWIVIALGRQSCPRGLELLLSLVSDGDVMDVLRCAAVRSLGQERSGSAPGPMEQNTSHCLAGYSIPEAFVRTGLISLLESDLRERREGGLRASVADILGGSVAYPEVVDGLAEDLVRAWPGEKAAVLQSLSHGEPEAVKRHRLRVADCLDGIRETQAPWGSILAHGSKLLIRLDADSAWATVERALDDLETADGAMGLYANNEAFRQAELAVVFGFVASGLQSAPAPLREKLAQRIRRSLAERAWSPQWRLNLLCSLVLVASFGESDAPGHAVTSVLGSPDTDPGAKLLLVRALGQRYASLDADARERIMNGAIAGLRAGDMEIAEALLTLSLAGQDLPDPRIRGWAEALDVRVGGARLGDMLDRIESTHAER